MPRKTKAKNFEVEDVAVAVVQTKNDDAIIPDNDIKEEDTIINDEVKEETKPDNSDEIKQEPVIDNGVKEETEPNIDDNVNKKRTKAKQATVIDAQPPPPAPIQHQSTKVTHNPYLNQRRMAYTRDGYEQRSTKYAELFKDAF